MSTNTDSVSITETERMSGGLIALGANLQHRGSGPQDVLLSALSQIHSAGLGIIAHSSFYRTPAWPAGSGPDFVNACAHLDVAGRTAAEVLSVLHGVEGDLGRERRQRWAARTCDLDLLAIGQQVVPDRPTVARWMALPAERQQGTAPDGLVLPHPRLHERAFVL
ncbi:MAG: 2-amino-4-hydroxy-6-hydroxymethyldihydropteridine diphosphokinase, partial [Pseudomonadota bacterium]